jgi:hypothetical protein
MVDGRKHLDKETTMEKTWTDKTGRTWSVTTDDTGTCTACGVHTSRPHVHVVHEESLWFPPVGTTQA